MTRDELSLLIMDGKQLLESQGCFQTKGAKCALLDMINQAEKALKGTSLPFTNKREFQIFGTEEQYKFAAMRYTMAPTYLKDGFVYDYYGLIPAMEWFNSRNMRNGNVTEWKARMYYILEKAKKALTEWKIGSQLGYYKEKERNILELTKEKLENALAQNMSRDDISKIAVECMDALADFRDTQILRTDIYEEDNLYLSKEGLKELKKRILTSPTLSKQFEEIKKYADEYTLDEVKDAWEWNFREDDYNKLNEKYYLWRTTEKTINFQVPAETKECTLSFTLPAIENEEEGLGHVWLDDVTLFEASGQTVEVRNGGFEEDEFQAYWTPMKKGRAIVKKEYKYPFCGSQKCSLYFENPDKLSEASVIYNERISVIGGSKYTLDFNSKIDGKLRKGLMCTIHFYRKDGSLCGTFTTYFNKKAYLEPKNYLLDIQCAAIYYWMTGDKNYARKVKYMILHQLNDFCQGACYWMVKNKRPDHSDAYGGVQGGRILCSLASAYSLIKGAFIFKKEEKECFYHLIEYMLRYMMDMRDRTELTPEEAQHNCGNWQTDMCSGTAYMMMVLPDFPNRKIWFHNARYVLKAQLKEKLNNDGSWPESIRYHNAVLQRFAGVASVIKHFTGEDWFLETRLTTMFSYVVRMQTPPYEYFNGHISTPAFGDHITGDGSEFAYFTTYFHEIACYDKKLADEMYFTWEKAGRPSRYLNGESVVLENLLVDADRYKPSINYALKLTSDIDHPQSGIYLFRKQCNDETMNYMAVMSSPKKIFHGHKDQGSFQIWYHNVPIIMDSGIEGYFDSSVNWHLSSYSHSVMQFATSKDTKDMSEGAEINLSAGNYSICRGWEDGPDFSQVLECNIGNKEESITLKIQNPAEEGYQIRRITWDKEADIYCIEDQVKGFTGNILFNLPIASEYTRMTEAGCFLSFCYYGIVLETKILSSVQRIWLEKGRTAPFLPSKEKIQKLEYIRIMTEAKNGFKIQLRPFRNDLRTK